MQYATFYEQRSARARVSPYDGQLLRQSPQQQKLPFLSHKAARVDADLWRQLKRWTAGAGHAGMLPQGVQAQARPVCRARPALQLWKDSQAWLLDHEEQGQTSGVSVDDSEPWLERQLNFQLAQRE